MEIHFQPKHDAGEEVEAELTEREAEQRGGERRQQLQTSSSARLLSLPGALSRGADNGADKEAERGEHGASRGAMTASSPPARKPRRGERAASATITPLLCSSLCS